MKKPKKNNNSFGFTLIETLLAMSILGTALVLLSQSWSGAFTTVRKTQNNFEIASLVERKMLEIDRLYRGKDLETIPEEQNEDFGQEFPEYSWKLKSRKFEFPDLSSVLTAREGGVDEMTSSLIKQLGDSISKAVKEVTLTVLYTPKGSTKKPQEHSITTYFINYDKEFSFGMPGGG